MRAPVVIEADPVTDDTTGVLKALESMAVNALVLEGSDDPLDHAVLLRGIRGDSEICGSIHSEGSLKLISH
jgi:hypothetical protein